MLTIRFQRIGKKKKPFYRIIISEKQRDTHGRYLEQLGSYNPHSKEALIKKDRVEHWLSVGAALSNSVKNLFIKEGLIKGDKALSVTVSKKRKAKLEEKKKEAAEKEAGEKKEVESAPEAEAPSEEPTAEAEAPAEDSKPAEEAEAKADAPKEDEEKKAE